MKKFILSFCLLSTMALAGIFEESFKIYPIKADDLFMTALSARNSSRQFEVLEIQTKNGYILFLYGSRYYLLTMTKRYQNKTEIKILPQNSDYSQGSEVAKSVFALIDYQVKNQPMEQIKQMTLRYAQVLVDINKLGTKTFSYLIPEEITKEIDSYYEITKIEEDKWDFIKKNKEKSK